jgi:TLD
VISDRQIRTRLPALARLSTSWTLLYSIDQHGISLNTLYTRCEAHREKSGFGSSQGTLLVMRDSGNTVFGAWIGDGIKLSKGAYCGSGESCVFVFFSSRVGSPGPHFFLTWQLFMEVLRERVGGV